MVERTALQEFVLLQCWMFHCKLATVRLYGIYELTICSAANIGSCLCASANVSGVIINTCGWVHGKGYQCIVQTAGAFEGI